MLNLSKLTRAFFWILQVTEISGFNYLYVFYQLIYEFLFLLFLVLSWNIAVVDDWFIIACVALMQCLLEEVMLIRYGQSFLNFNALYRSVCLSRYCFQMSDDFCWVYQMLFKWSIFRLFYIFWKTGLILEY